MHASEIFINEGCFRVTMDDVAKRLHVSKRTLYEQFGDKKSLMEEVLCGIKEKTMSKMGQYHKMMANKDKNMLHALLFTMSNYEQYNRQYFLLLDDVRRAYPDLMKRLFMPNEVALERELRNHLTSMYEAGYIREGANLELAAWILAQFVVQPLSNKDHSYDSNVSVACESSFTYIRGLLKSEMITSYEAQEPEIREIFKTTME